MHWVTWYNQPSHVELKGGRFSCAFGVQAARSERVRLVPSVWLLVEVMKDRLGGKWLVMLFHVCWSRRDFSILSLIWNFVKPLRLWILPARTPGPCSLGLVPTEQWGPPSTPTPFWSRSFLHQLDWPRPHTWSVSMSAAPVQKRNSLHIIAFGFILHSPHFSGEATVWQTYSLPKWYTLSEANIAPEK